jgi:hypothetical protein
MNTWKVRRLQRIAAVSVLALLVSRCGSLSTSSQSDQFSKLSGPDGITIGPCSGAR